PLLGDRVNTSAPETARASPNIRVQSDIVVMSMGYEHMGAVEFWRKGRSSVVDRRQPDTPIAFFDDAPISGMPVAVPQPGVEDEHARERKHQGCSCPRLERSQRAANTRQRVLALLSFWIVSWI